MNNNILDLSSLKLKISKEEGKFISNFIIVDLPDNKRGLLFIKYNSSYEVDEFGDNLLYLTITTPIFNFDNTVYSDDFFKIGKYLRDAKPIVEITRDENSLYLALSYNELKLSRYRELCKIDHDRRTCKISKYRFPDFSLEWEQYFPNGIIQSITVNDKELAFFDMHTCEALYLNKFDGKYMNKKINLSMNGKLELQNISIDNPNFNRSSHHDIVFIGNNLMAASYTNDVIIVDENLEVMHTFDSKKTSFADSIINGGKIRSLQSNTEENHIYFVSGKKLMVIDNDSVKIVKEFNINIDKISFNTKDKSLLIYMCDDRGNVEVQIMSVHMINELINKDINSYLGSKILLPKHK